MTEGREGGQALVEFAILITVFFMLTVGLIDVGRAFYEYNAVASAARYAARWGSVVGGTCATAEEQYATSSNDWCYQMGTQPVSTSTLFWQQLGNKPQQPSSTTCPTSYDKTFAYYYTVSDYASSTSTTIVGAVAQRFDTSNSSSNLINGAATPGFDLTQMKVCIQLPWSSALSQYDTTPGSRIGVYVYYPFTPITTMITKVTFNLKASSTYGIE